MASVLDAIFLFLASEGDQLFDDQLFNFEKFEKSELPSDFSQDFKWRY